MGVLSVTTGAVKLEFKNIWKELVAIIIIILWANFGNNVYSNEEHHYDDVEKMIAKNAILTEYGYQP